MWEQAQHIHGVERKRLGPGKPEDEVRDGAAEANCDTWREPQRPWLWRQELGFYPKSQE